MTRGGAPYGGSRVLVVGIGGLGCPAAMALVRAGVGTLGLCDDDRVERSNLHRQILFGEADVGARKVDAAARAIRDRCAREHLPAPDVLTWAERLGPHNALKLVRDYDVVLEGSDNFATKFLTADACALAGVAVVHASAVRWVGNALAVGAGGRPCYRCLFEDAPALGAPNCAEGGILGPVAGVVAAAQVDLALALLLLDGAAKGGELVTFDGRADVLRRRTVARRRDCPLCGASAGRGIDRIEPKRYVSPACAG